MLLSGRFSRSPARARRPDAPDWVAAVAALCAVKRVSAELEGVAHLRLKESDRIDALQKELFKVGCNEIDRYRKYEV